MSFNPTINPFYCDSRGKLTSATMIATLPGALVGCLINTDGSNAATLKLYDAASAGAASAGNQKWKHTVLGTDRTGGGFPLAPIKYKNLYASVGGTGAEIIVYTVR